MRFEALNNLWERVRESNHDFRASTQIFPSLDIDRIARDLELEKQAEERGTADEPPSVATSYDEIELAVIERIEAEKKAAHQVLEDQLQIFGERLTNLDFESQFGMIRQANLTTVTDYEVVGNLGLNELYGPRRGLEGAEHEYTKFRCDHGLTRREPRLQPIRMWWLKILFLVACVIAEMVFNGVFLSVGSEQGLVGGTTLALGFAILNIGVAIIAAHLIKYNRHRSFLGRLAGAGAVLTYPILASGINLAIAHYRETSEVLFGEAGREVMRRMMEEPLLLADINSWVLFGVGLLFSLVALIDAWFLSDPYPGYGSVAKRLKRCREDYIIAYSNQIESLREIRDDNTSKIEEIIRDLSARKREYDAIIAHRSRLSQLFEQHQNHLEHAGNALLSVYRTRNRKARATEPPKHFGMGYSLIRIQPPVALIGELNDADLQASIRQARDELIRQAQRIADEFKAAFARFSTLDTLHLDRSNGQAKT